MMPEIRQEGDTMGEFLGKRVIPRHEGDWDKARSYEPLMIVLDPVISAGMMFPPVRCSQTSTTGQGAVISMPRCTVWKQMWQKMWKECTQILLIRSLR